MHMLETHGDIADPDFNRTPLESLTIAALDRISNEINWSAFNAIRTAIQQNHGATNDYLLAFADRYAYGITMTGHSHLWADHVFQHKWPNGDVQGLRFLNPGAWLKGLPKKYVLLPRGTKTNKKPRAKITDIHAGTPECDVPAVMAFFDFCDGKDWAVDLDGDIVDEYAFSLAEIMTSNTDHRALIERILGLKDWTWMPGNHDGFDVLGVRKLLQIPDSVETPKFRVTEIDDAPEAQPAVIGFPG